MVDVTINDYLTLFQDMAQLTKMKMHPEVDFLESTQLTKFESEYPTTSK